jgi:hypothetical protein
LKLRKYLSKKYVKSTNEIAWKIYTTGSGREKGQNGHDFGLKWQWMLVATWQHCARWHSVGAFFSAVISTYMIYNTLVMMRWLSIALHVLLLSRTSCFCILNSVQCAYLFILS